MEDEHNELKMGNQLRFTCSFNRSKPKPHIIWFVDGKEVSWFPCLLKRSCGVYFETRCIRLKCFVAEKKRLPTEWKRVSWWMVTAAGTNGGLFSLKWSYYQLLSNLIENGSTSAVGWLSSTRPSTSVRLRSMSLKIQPLFTIGTFIQKTKLPILYPFRASSIKSLHPWLRRSTVQILYRYQHRTEVFNSLFFSSI